MIIDYELFREIYEYNNGYPPGSIHITNFRMYNGKFIIKVSDGEFICEYIFDDDIVNKYKKDIRRDKLNELINE